ncbi:hypothetical protein FRB90_009044, partial [Tulasnella sp. 427]
MSWGNQNEQIPTPAYLTPTPASRVQHPASSTSSSAPTVPSLLRTPPSTGDLAETAAAAGQGSSHSGNGPRLSPPLDSQQPVAGPSRSTLGSISSLSQSNFGSDPLGATVRPAGGQQQPPDEPTSSRPGAIPFPSKGSNGAPSPP